MPGSHSAPRIFVGKIRRFFTVHFRKEYVGEQLAARSGECHQCGTCCNFSLACPLLTRDRLCLAYGKCRPKACRVFPVDEKDLADVKACGGKCGYSFPNR